MLLGNTSAKYPVSFVKIATNHIETYTGLKIRNVVLLTSSLYENEDSQFYDDFRSIPSSRVWRDVFVQHHRLVNSGNGTNHIKLIQRDSSPSIVLIYDVDTLTMLSHELEDNPTQYMGNKIWLISLIGEYNSPDEMNKAVMDTTTSFQNYFSL